VLPWRSFVAHRVADLSERVAPFLKPGERLLATVPTAAALGAVEARSGVRASRLVFRPAERRNTAAAGRSGIKLAAQTGIALSDARLMTFDETVSPTGRILKIELLSATPVSDLDGVEVSRRGLGGRLAIDHRTGERVEIECLLGPARQLSAAFQSLRGPDRSGGVG
jgi:hypothetical protein